MGMGKIIFGVIFLIVAILTWSMLASPEGAVTQLLFATPAERFSFSESLQSLKAIYFLVSFGIGLGVIFWGVQD